MEVEIKEAPASVAGEQLAKRRVVLLISNEWAGLYVATSLKRAGLNIVRVLMESEPGQGLSGMSKLRKLKSAYGSRMALRRMLGLPFGLAYALRRAANRREHPLLSDLRTLGLRVQTVDDLRSTECESMLRDLSPDITVICGTPILPENILNVASLATLNTHTSVLPYYRGGGSTFWPLFFRDAAKAGYTIHRAVAKVDAGEILAQEAVPVSSSDTPATVLRKCFQASVPRLIDILKKDPLDASSFHAPSLAVSFAFRAPDQHTRMYLHTSLAQRAKSTASEWVKRAALGVESGKRSAKPAVTIFYYHRVLTDDTPANDWRRLLGHDTQSDFHKKLQYLKQRYDIISMAELTRLLEEGKAPSESLAVVTADDGYRDLLTNALPVHQALGVPATFFICTGGVREGTVWFQRVYDLIDGWHGERLNVPWMGTSLYFGDSRQRMLTAEKVLIGYLKRLNRERRRERLMQMLEANPGIETSTVDEFCRPEDLKTLAEEELIELHLHSHTHDPYETLTPEQVREDISRCVEELYSMAAVRSRVMSFPNGGSRPEHEPVLSACGVRYAMSTKRGSEHIHDTRPLFIHRTCMCLCSLPEFHWILRN